VQSVAAEGGILAADASRGRSTQSFVRIHGTELSKAAGASTAILAKGRAPAAHALADLATRLGDELDRLAHSGSDRAEQRRLAAELRRDEAEAAGLGKRL
jgi:hypothetical protein